MIDAGELRIFQAFNAHAVLRCRINDDRERRRRGLVVVVVRDMTMLDGKEVGNRTRWGFHYTYTLDIGPNNVI